MLNDKSRCLRKWLLGKNLHKKEGVRYENLLNLFLNLFILIGG